MKKLTQILAVAIITIFSLNTLQANTLMHKASHSEYTDAEMLTLVSASDLMFRADDVISRAAIKSVNHNSITNMVQIITEETIAKLEIRNGQGELEFILPIGAKILNLDLLDYAKGTYSIHLTLQNKEEIQVKSTMVKAF